MVKIVWYEAMVKEWEMWREFSKWVFELLRNLMITGLLMALAQKSRNPYLIGLVVLAWGALFSYCWTYFYTWGVDLNLTRHKRINVALSFLLSAGILSGAMWAVPSVLGEIVTGIASVQNPR